MLSISCSIIDQINEITSWNRQLNIKLIGRYKRGPNIITKLTRETRRTINKNLNVYKQEREEENIYLSSLRYGEQNGYIFITKVSYYQRL